MTSGEAVVISLDGIEYPIPKLSAERGLQAAEMLIPFLMTLRPAIEEIAADRASGAEGRTYTEIGMDVAIAILPQLKAADVLRLGQLLTGIDYDVLAAAPLPETLEAIVTAGRAIDFASLVATANKLIGMSGQAAVAPAAPEVEGKRTLTQKPEG